jgi:hypothetical protein
MRWIAFASPHVFKPIIRDRLLKPTVLLKHGQSLERQPGSLRIESDQVSLLQPDQAEYIDARGRDELLLAAQQDPPAVSVEVPLKCPDALPLMIQVADTQQAIAALAEPPPRRIAVGSTSGWTMTSTADVGHERSRPGPRRRFQS